MTCSRVSTTPQPSAPAASHPLPRRAWIRSVGVKVGPAPLLVAALSACSNPPPPAPNTYIKATLGPHLDSMNNNLCSNGSPLTALEIGTAAATPIGTSNGDSFQGTGVSVSCSVNGGFSINLQATKQGSGTVTIVGNVGMTGGTGIYANIISNSLSYTQSDCTIAYTYMGNPVQTTPVAAGRIWAHLKCPSMTDRQQKLLSSGQYVQEMCDGEADFFFQNCDQ
jgi:hypothetical protein